MWTVDEKDFHKIAKWGLESDPFRAIGDFSEVKKELRWSNPEHREVWDKIVRRRFERIGNHERSDRKDYYKSAQKPVKQKIWEYLIKRKAWYIMPLCWDNIAVNAEKVIDLGCGDGDTVQRLITYVNDYWKQHTISDRYLHIVGTELNQSRVENARNLVRSENPKITFEFRIDDIAGEGLKYEDGYFDYALTTAVIESLNDDDCEGFVGEMCRVTRKGIYIEDLLEDLPGGYPRENLGNLLDRYGFYINKKHVIFSELFDVDRLTDPKKLWPIMLVQNIWAERKKTE